MELEGVSTFESLLFMAKLDSPNDATNRTTAAIDRPITEKA